jgi:glucose/arabinose dehydrogenase
MPYISRNLSIAACLAAVLCASVLAQAPSIPLPDGPFTFDTSEGIKIKVVLVARNLAHPWGIVFLPNGDMLVTERPGRVRLIHDGVLDPKPVDGVPQVKAQGLHGLMDIALHPQFAENHWVYLTYTKATDRGQTIALARGRWDGSALADTKDIFIADAYGENPGAASRIAFARDGSLYMTVGGAYDLRAQAAMTDFGKVLRLKDDGSIPADNPFRETANYRAEIYSIGHRNQTGLTVHPVSGAIWESENGPNGGDEVNIILPGKNYGWPLVSYGINYDGKRVSDHAWQEGIEEPKIVWVPSIAVSNISFYTGDRFPKWKGNLFAGGMRTGEVAGTGHLERIVFNDRGEEMRRESLLTTLHQRIRDVRQGPDGLLYVLTEEQAGALLRIEPAS